MLIALATVALAAPLAQAEREPLPTVVTEVRVFREDGSLTGPHDVVLRDGRIDAILPAGEADRAALRVVDGAGGTLLPGLIDLHVHVDGVPMVPSRLRLPDAKGNLEAFAYAGVTTVFDLGMDRDGLARLQERIDRGRWTGPRLFGTGHPFTAPEGHPRSMMAAAFPALKPLIAMAEVANEVEGRNEVEAALEAMPPVDGLKVMLDAIPSDAPLIGDEALAALREGATARGVPLLAHVGRPDDLARAAALPVDAVVHAPHTGRLPADVVDALAERSIPMVPTLAIWESVDDLVRGRPRLEPMSEEVLPRRIARDFERAARKTPRVADALASWAQGVAESTADRTLNVRDLRAAGVPLLVGSDSPNIGLVPGVATHRELQLLHRHVGIPAREVLRVATWENSRFLDPDATFGAVREGWEADLLLVDGDPTRHLDAVHAIQEVFLDGRRVERDPRGRK